MVLRASKLLSTSGQERFVYAQLVWSTYVCSTLEICTGRYWTNEDVKENADYDDRMLACRIILVYFATYDDHAWHYPSSPSEYSRSACECEQVNKFRSTFRTRILQSHISVSCFVRWVWFNACEYRTLETLTTPKIAVYFLLVLFLLDLENPLLFHAG